MKISTTELKREIDELKNEKGNVCVVCHTVWSAEQIKAVIEASDKQNEMIKMEITHGFEPGKKSYELIVWSYPKLVS